MKALVFERSIPRLAITKLLSTLTPRDFVGSLFSIAAIKAPAAR